MDRAQKVILTNMCMIEKNNKILVQDKVSKTYSGITFPGGHIEKDEPLTDAVIREVWEETGLTVTNPVMKGIYDWIIEDGTRYFVFLYKASEFQGELHSSSEGETYWISKEELLKMKLAQGMEKVFEIIENDRYSECFWDKTTETETETVK